MKATIPSITVQFTVDEIRILRAIDRNLYADDPCGDASKELQCGIEIVVDVKEEFRRIMDQVNSL